MVSIGRGQELHDKATRKVPLTSTEELELREWYDQMDSSESILIPVDSDPNSLNSQIDATLASIQVTTRKIIAVRQENRRILKRIIDRERKLTTRHTHPAP